MFTRAKWLQADFETMAAKWDYGGAPWSCQKPCKTLINICIYLYTHGPKHAHTHLWQVINSKLKACREDEEVAKRLSSLVSSLDCWSSDCAKSASKSSSIPQSLTQAANTLSHHNDRWRYNHTLTLLTEIHTRKNTWVSGIDCAFLEAWFLGVLRLWRFSFFASAGLWS